MAVFDATALIHFFDANANAAVDPSTGEPVRDAAARVRHLVQTLKQQGEKVIVPTPALSEFLVHASRASGEYQQVIHGSGEFRVVPFDEQAAVELAAITRSAVATGNLRAGADATRAALKFDRQIIAIARVEGETTIYSDDVPMSTLAAKLGIEVVRTYDLPQPPMEQSSLAYNGTPS